MSDLKNKLIAEINAQEDEELLRDIYDLLVNEEQEKEVIRFTEEQQSRIRESEEAYKAGKTISDEDLQQKLNDWLGK